MVKKNLTHLDLFELCILFFMEKLQIKDNAPI